MRKTKIICTIGPASENEETLTRMCRSGMNVARLNFSHGTHDEHQKKFDIVKLVREKLGYKARGIELNVCQRCAGHLLSKTDISESKLIGKKGVDYAVKNYTGRMMTFKRISDSPYKIKIENADITNIANVEKKVPLKWIKNGNDIKEEQICYLRHQCMIFCYSS